MIKIGKKSLTSILCAAVAVLLAASLVEAGEARMLTDAELDQITGASTAFENGLPERFADIIARTSEHGDGDRDPGTMDDRGMVNIGNAVNSNIISQTNFMNITGGISGGSIKQINIGIIGFSKEKE